MPTSELSPMVQPCSMARWPIVQPSPICQRVAHVRVHRGMFLHIGVATDANQLVVAAQHRRRTRHSTFSPRKTLPISGSVRRYPIRLPDAQIPVNARQV